MLWEQRFADRVSRLGESASVIEILKLSEREDVISFSGGLPDPAVFSIEKIRECSARVLAREAEQALNYGPNPGYTKLREWLVEWMQLREGVTSHLDDILITTGGLEALHLICLALVDPGSSVLTTSPAYLAALHVFRSHQARIHSIETDEQGLNPDSLRERLLELENSGRRARLLYLVPTFDNPTGLTLSQQRREQLLELCQRFEIPIVEDSAYAQLRYDGDDQPCLKSLAPESVIFIHTFSKIFGPGVRLGWIAADSRLAPTLGLCKLGTDQCANTFTQRVLYECARQGCVGEHLQRSIDLYRLKRDSLLRELTSRMPEGVSWTRPQGGFYVWLKLPEGADSRRLFQTALQTEKVAFVEGRPFFGDGRGQRFLRLSFSYLPNDDIPEGVRRLERVLS